MFYWQHLHIPEIKETDIKFFSITNDSNTISSIDEIDEIFKLEKSKLSIAWITNNRDEVLLKAGLVGIKSLYEVPGEINFDLKNRKTNVIAYNGREFMYKDKTKILLPYSFKHVDNIKKQNKEDFKFYIESLIKELTEETLDFPSLTEYKSFNLSTKKTREKELVRRLKHVKADLKASTENIQNLTDETETIEEQLKNTDEETNYESFKLLLKDFESLSYTTDGMKGITKPICLFHDGKFWPLGRFSVEVDIRKERVKVFGENHSSNHPHLSDGNMCFGTRGEAFQASLKARNLASTLRQVVNLLNTYSPGDCYHKIETIVSPNVVEVETCWREKMKEKKPDLEVCKSCTKQCHHKIDFFIDCNKRNSADCFTCLDACPFSGSKL